MSIPSTADEVHPTDHSAPSKQLPKAARAHTAAGAGAFAAWYERWLLYAYVARTVEPLKKYTHDCAECASQISYVKDFITKGQSFSGQIDATAPIRVDPYASTAADALVKWSNPGYKLVADDGTVVSHFDGGEGYYVIKVVWRGGSWFTRQIVVVDL